MRQLNPPRLHRKSPAYKVRLERLKRRKLAQILTQLPNDK